MGTTSAETGSHRETDVHEIDRYALDGVDIKTIGTEVCVQESEYNKNRSKENFHVKITANRSLKLTFCAHQRMNYYYMKWI